MDKIKTRELPKVGKKEREKVILREEEVPSKPNRVRINKVQTYNPSIKRTLLGGKSLMKQVDYLVDKLIWNEANHAEAVHLLETITRDYSNLKDAKDTGPIVAKLASDINAYSSK